MEVQQFPSSPRKKKKRKLSPDCAVPLSSRKLLVLRPATLLFCCFVQSHRSHVPCFAPQKKYMKLISSSEKALITPGTLTALHQKADGQS